MMEKERKAVISKDLEDENEFKDDLEEYETAGDFLDDAEKEEEEEEEEKEDSN